MSLTKVSYSMIAGATANILDFGAVGNGISDDTAAIQAAIDSITPTGGTIYFPAGKYVIKDQLNVRSVYPVHLIGNMGGQEYNPATQTNLSGLIIGANIAGAMIKYSAPPGKTRGEAGGGNISGLNFYDATGSGALPGIYTCTSALNLFDFCLSKVENCHFHWINGGAIYGEFTVMTNIVNNIIRYCGASGKPAIELKNVTLGFPPQSMALSSNRVEVCHGDSYIKVSGVQATDIKIINNGFEAETSIATSNQKFLDLGGSRISVVGNSFNRTDSVQVLAGASDSVISNNTFAGGAFTSSALVITGGRVSVIGNMFSSVRKKYEIEVKQQYCLVNANNFYYSGAVFIDASRVSFTNNMMVDLTADPAEFAAADQWWVQVKPGSTYSSLIISGNNLSKTASPPFAEFGGIRSSSNPILIANNFIQGFTGPGTGGVGIRTETTVATVVGNVGADITTVYETTGYSELVVTGNNQLPNLTTFPLRASVAYNPPLLADGDGVTTTVTVTGAALGDYVTASFTQDLQGVTMTAYAFEVNGVAVRFQNETGAPVDLASGFIKVIVQKR